MPTDEEIFVGAIEQWGVGAQLGMVVEECAELIKEINKYQRGTDNVIKLVEEIIDVKIMVKQIELIFSRYTPDMIEIYESKMKRIEGLLYRDGYEFPDDKKEDDEKETSEEKRSCFNCKHGEGAFCNHPKSVGKAWTECNYDWWEPKEEIKNGEKAKAKG